MSSRGGSQGNAVRWMEGEDLEATFRELETRPGAWQRWWVVSDRVAG